MFWFGTGTKCGGVKPVNWNSNANTYIQIRFLSKRPHTIVKMKYNINMESTKTRSMNVCTC